MSWAAVAASAIGVVGGYITSKKAGKKSKADRAAQDVLTKNLQQLGPLGQKYSQQGSDALGTATRRYSNILGSRDQAMGEIAPELNTRAEGDRAAIGTMGEMAPRGGVASDYLSRLPFKRIGETTNLLHGARSNATGSLGMIGSDLIGKGLSAFGAGNSGALGQLGYGLNNNQQQFDFASSGGQAIYDLIKAWGKSRTTGTTGTTGTPPPSTSDPSTVWGGYQPYRGF